VVSQAAAVVLLELLELLLELLELLEELLVEELLLLLLELVEELLELLELELLLLLEPPPHAVRPWTKIRATNGATRTASPVDENRFPFGTG
jgi:hypothetical protein